MMKAWDSTRQASLKRNIANNVWSERQVKAHQSEDVIKLFSCLPQPPSVTVLLPLISCLKGFKAHLILCGLPPRKFSLHKCVEPSENPATNIHSSSLQIFF